MTRVLAHLGLVVVLLSCPLLCGTGLAGCSGCENADVTSRADNSQTRHCCHHENASDSACNDADNPTEPTTPPEQQGHCPSDCLCDGAVESTEDIARALPAHGWSPLDALAVVAISTTDQQIASATRPLKPLSGLTMRIEQMSLLL